MNTVIDKYNQLSSSPSDINEHLPTICKYASECESVMELGVRGCVSSWALVKGLMENNKSKKQILLNDITSCDINKLLNVGVWPLAAIPCPLVVTEANQLAS